MCQSELNELLWKYYTMAFHYHDLLTDSSEIYTNTHLSERHSGSKVTFRNQMAEELDAVCPDIAVGIHNRSYRHPKTPEPKYSGDLKTKAQVVSTTPDGMRRQFDIRFFKSELKGVFDRPEDATCVLMKTGTPYAKMCDSLLLFIAARAGIMHECPYPLPYVFLAFNVTPKGIYCKEDGNWTISDVFTGIAVPVEALTPGCTLEFV